MAHNFVTRKGISGLEIFHIFGKTVSTSCRIKLPSIALPCTDLDIYPKALSVISWKYTKAKITFIRVKCHRFIGHAAGATYSQLT